MSAALPVIVLASRSPRRAELLHAAGITFTVRVADVDETQFEGESPRDYVLRVAEEKARAVESTQDEIVLGADTSVVIDGRTMGKPSDTAEAMRMLRSLSGRKHEVITGICLKRAERILRDVEATAVWFAPLNEQEIHEYVEFGEPMDKAGAYGIQGLASRFVTRIEGSYTNVVGLPVALIYSRLQELLTTTL